MRWKYERAKGYLLEVTTGVESSMAPIYLSIPYSSSANPCHRKILLEYVDVKVQLLHRGLEILQWQIKYITGYGQLPHPYQGEHRS